LKLDKWLESKISELCFSDICIVIHIQDGSVKWIEKVLRETEKVSGNSLEK
jgi:hypothetical protein